MRLRSPASLPERSGRVRGGRASPGAVVELPFRRSRPAPRSRFPRALRLAALASGLTGSPPMTLLPATRGGHDFRRRSAQEARGEQAEAIHRPPQGPPKYPSPGLHRSTTARRHRGAGSDALPTDGMGRSLARVPARMVCDAVFFGRRAKSGGWWRGICWQSADCQRSVKGRGRLRSAEVHHDEHNGFTEDTTGPVPPGSVGVSGQGRIQGLRPKEMPGGSVRSRTGP